MFCFLLLSLLLGNNLTTQQPIQTAVTALVVNAQTHEPLAYVNVGVVGRDIGTVTDESGRFTLDLNKEFDNDTLRFSMIGFAPHAALVSDYRALFAKGNGLVALDPTVYQLHNVNVRPHAYKEKIIGNRTTTRSAAAGFASNDLGCEAGVRVKVKKNKPVYLKQFSASVASNIYDTIYFRINVYELDNDGMPTRNAMFHNVVIKSTVKSGVLQVDLTPYNVVLEDDAVVTLEWLKDLGGTKGLYFSAQFFNGPIYYRKTSQGKWNTAGGAGLGFWLTVDEQQD
jgi:hypothetical protein